jgi:transcriptional regulator with PAS, ATPase and Fis domain
MKILTSWIANNNDFKDGSISSESPNLIYHKYFYDHDKHIILSSANENDKDTKAEMLYTYLKNEFDGRNIEIKYLNISDVISIEEIKPKIESLLISLQNDEIDIFISPGTSMMQISWYICHTTLGLKTRLLQTRPKKFTKNKVKPDLLELKTEKAKEGYSAAIREANIEDKSLSSEDYLLTESIKPIYEKAYKVASTDNVTCLINGESGTGKENLAKYIHKESSRSTKPFITVNCSALGDQLLESRLFGYKKGSFTGADKDTIGLFQQADGGTIFLDEIGDISPYMQQSLLRVLQEKEITPIGGKSLKVDIRIIAATHKDLSLLCANEKFRWDLYYRLNVVELELPPLRLRTQNERKEMLDYFLKKKKIKMKRNKQLKLSKEVESVLLSYPFAGNVREMENMIESLYVFSEETVKLSDLPKRVEEKEKETTLNWKANEKLLIEKALKIYKGNQRQTLKALGYKSINTLTSKIKEYNIQFE